MRSKFAPSHPVHATPIDGISIKTTHCGLKTSGNPDLLIITFAHFATVVGVFTQSTTSAAPVDWCKSHIHSHQARALVVHSGNANASTGARGATFVQTIAEDVAQHLSCDPATIYVAATGIIGQPVPESIVRPKLSELLSDRHPSGEFEAAATAIMTTDTYAKISSISVTIDNRLITITAIAKGSGMIAPNMATMLAFGFTNLAIDPLILDTLFKEVNAATFSRITVDGDTSTNDTSLFFSTNAIHPLSPITDIEDPRLAPFRTALHHVYLDLAHQIVKDGEGISKFISITCQNASTPQDAHLVAKTIAESPLVKTAVAGCSPNWGRIVMAIGRSGAMIEKAKIAIQFGPYTVSKNGEAVESVDHDGLLAYMKNDEISITVDIGLGTNSDTVWTCDLTHGYIDINANYTT